MATRTWTGFNGDWTDTANWAGGIVPVSGDVVVSGTGTARMNSVAISNENITFSGSALQLTLSDATLDAATVVNLGAAPGSGGNFTLAISGNSSNAGRISATTPTSIYLIPGTGGVFNNSGTLSLSANTTLQALGTIANSGVLKLTNTSGGAGLTLGVTGAVSIANSGSIAIEGTLGAQLSDTAATFGAFSGNGTVSADHGQVVFSQSVGSGGVFSFAHSIGAQFSSLGLTLASNNFGSTITGFAAGDVIDLGIGAADTLAYTPDVGGTSGTLTISNAGTAKASLAFAGAYTNASFNLVPNALTDFLLTANAPCFAAGTALMTARGEVRVEDLRVGDILPTQLGGNTAVVVWTGWRGLNCRNHPRPQDVLPVRVHAGAFGPGVPARDVVLSPDHAVFQDGHLVPIRYLLNGATIVQEAAGSITYWHVELDRHSVVSAAGLPVESYLDTGNRGAFANGGLPVQLHPDFALRVWDAESCAPLCTAGPVLAEIRTRLLARAAELGHMLTDATELRVLVDGRALAVQPLGPVYHVSLPAGARQVMLCSRSAVPAEIYPDNHDGRRLGVAVSEVRLNGDRIAGDDVRFAAGWHQAESVWRWTDGTAVLDVAGGRELSFEIAMTAAYWAVDDRPRAELQARQ